MVEHDVRKPYDIDVSLIFNFASPASPPDYQRDPVGTLLTNVLGAVNVLEVARRCGATVVQSSTSEVYGDPLVNPQPESYFGNVNTIGPRACYDEGKRSAETLFSIITAFMASISRLGASSAPMGRAYPMTSGWSPTSSSRR